MKNVIATGEILVVRQLRAVTMALIFLAVSAGHGGAQTESTVAGWVNSFLPKGITVKTSTSAQLPAAVVAAIRAHPEQAKAIVRYVFSQFSATDKSKATAVIDAMIASLPADEIADLIGVGIGSLSATIDPATGQSALLGLSSSLTERAIADDPALGTSLLTSIGAAAPGQQGLQGSGPGNVTNPASSVNISGTVNSPQ